LNKKAEVIWERAKEKRSSRSFQKMKEKLAGKLNYYRTIVKVRLSLNGLRTVLNIGEKKN